MLRPAPSAPVELLVREFELSCGAGKLKTQRSIRVDPVSNHLWRVFNYRLEWLLKTAGVKVRRGFSQIATKRGWVSGWVKQKCLGPGTGHRL